MFSVVQQPGKESLIIAIVVRYWALGNIFLIYVKFIVLVCLLPLLIITIVIFVLWAR